MNWKQFEKDWKNEVPLHYHLQVQHYLAVTGWKFAVLFANIRLEWTDESILKRFNIERDEDDIKEIIKKEIWFNSFVINDIEPPSKTKLMIQEEKMGTQELQVIEFEVTELVPAKVISNIDDLKKFMGIVKQKYEGWIVTEDDIDIAKSERTKLNKLEKKISDERKKIQKKANADIEALIENLKTYEKEVKGISNFIGEQLKGYDEKIREEKKVEVQKKINNIFTRNPGLKIFLEWNDKWLDKSFTFKKIENEVQKQHEELEKKQDFINSQIEKANAEIQFMITFESMKFLMSEDYSVITEKIESKKNEIKQTEENLKQKAEEEKHKALEEAEIQKQKEIEEIKRQQTVRQNIEMAKENTKNEKHFDTTIRFENASLSFLKELKVLLNKYEMKYQLLENIELQEEIKWED